MADNKKEPRNFGLPQKVRHFLGAFLFMGISKYSLEFKKSCVDKIIQDQLSVKALSNEFGLDKTLLRR